MSEEKIVIHVFFGHYSQKEKYEQWEEDILEI